MPMSIGIGRSLDQRRLVQCCTVSRKPSLNRSQRYRNDPNGSESHAPKSTTGAGSLHLPERRHQTCGARPGATRHHHKRPAHLGLWPSASSHHRYYRNDERRARASRCFHASTVVSSCCSNPTHSKPSPKRIRSSGGGSLVSAISKTAWRSGNGKVVASASSMASYKSLPRGCASE